jgi:hypothetical protein
LRSSDRLMEKEEISFLEDFEQTILGFLRTLNRAPEREKRPIWDKMEQYLADSNNSLLEIATLLRGWVGLHLTGEPIVERMQREQLNN